MYIGKKKKAIVRGKELTDHSSTTYGLASSKRDNSQKGRLTKCLAPNGNQSQPEDQEKETQLKAGRAHLSAEGTVGVGRKKKGRLMKSPMMEG